MGSTPTSGKCWGPVLKRLTVERYLNPRLTLYIKKVIFFQSATYILSLFHDATNVLKMELSHCSQEKNIGTQVRQLIFSAFIVIFMDRCKNPAFEGCSSFAVLFNRKIPASTRDKYCIYRTKMWNWGDD